MRETLTTHRYQENAAIFCALRRGAGVFAEPGLGKCVIALRLVQIVRPKRALIVAPKSVAWNTWPDELDKWDIFDDLSYTIVHNEKEFDPAAQIHITNPESLRLPIVRKTKYDLIIIDESTLFKSRASLRFKRAMRIAKRAKWRIILTGNPIPKNYQDLYAQIKLIDSGAALGKTLGQFRTRYFNAVPKRITNQLTIIDYELRQGADKLIQRAISKRVAVINSDGNLEIPPLIENNIFVALDKSEQTLYDSFEKEMFAEIDSGELITFTAGSKYQKCAQLANGAAYDENRNVLQLHDRKLDALESLIHELNGSPLLVAYKFNHDLDRIKARFPKAVGYSPDAINKWNRKDLKVFCVQYQSMSRGLNLQNGGRHLCCFSLTDNFDDYYQMVRRLYRQGAADKTFVHRIVTRNTVDQMCLVRLERRQAQAIGFLESLRAYKFLKERGLTKRQPRPRLTESR